MQLDLADLESVRKFVDDFHATDKQLSVLINNAGTLQNFKDTRRQYTKDNFELTMGTNHIGNISDDVSSESDFLCLVHTADTDKTRLSCLVLSVFAV